MDTIRHRFLFPGPALLLLAAAIGNHRAAAAPSPDLPDLAITLGPQNAAAGLRVPSGGDGTNEPVTVAGQSARRISTTTGERNLYLYVAIDHPAYAAGGPRNLYAVVELLDDIAGMVSLQYDKAAETPDVHSKYAASEQTALLVGTGKWRRATFSLPQARLGHGQNGGADFRLACRGLAVRSITVTPRVPQGFDPDAAYDPESLRAMRTERPAGMELTFGNDATPAQAALYRALSVTSVESYVDWAGVEPEENQWDWSKWDKQLATLKAANLKWVPFLIAGSAYATPLWFHRGPHSRYYRCIEHGGESRVQSIFNPEWRTYVERFISAFAARYGDGGQIESVLLGVTGIYGESIYPAGPQGGWTARLTGDYHNHHGWWAGDAYAAAAFRTAMGKQYNGSIAALNAAWGTKLDSFDQVAPFLPDKAPSDRARADFVEWYQQAMTDWATFWVAATRKAMPNVEIYLCTGGDGTPSLGADFTAQAAAIAPYGAGIRITNEGSDYAHNFSLTREVATATRHYGTFCGFEPASGVTPAGVVGRIYNATTSGARQLHYYTNNVLGSTEAIQAFRGSAAVLLPRKPRVDVAFYLPRETWAIEPKLLGHCYGQSRALRDLVDHDYVTRRSVADGILPHYRALVLTEAPVLEPAAAATIEKWVNDGGILVEVRRADDKTAEPLGSRLYDNAAWHQRLFAKAGTVAESTKAAPVGKGFAVIVDATGKQPAPAAAASVYDAIATLLGTKAFPRLDGRADKRFVTQTERGTLLLDANDATIH